MAIISLGCNVVSRTSSVFFSTETHNHQPLNGTHNSLLEAEVRYLHEEPEKWKRGKQFLAVDLMAYSTTQSRTLARYREES